MCTLQCVCHNVYITMCMLQCVRFDVKMWLLRYLTLLSYLLSSHYLIWALPSFIILKLLLLLIITHLILVPHSHLCRITELRWTAPFQVCWLISTGPLAVADHIFSTLYIILPANLWGDSQPWVHQLPLATPLVFYSKALSVSIATGHYTTDLIVYFCSRLLLALDSLLIFSISFLKITRNCYVYSLYLLVSLIDNQNIRSPHVCHSITLDVNFP